MRENQLGKLITNLPEKPGILGREQFFSSAVLVPLVLINGEYYFLFEKRAQNIKQEGEICFPGGGYDPETDRDFAATAIRETLEEIGIAADKINIVGRLDYIITPFGSLVEPIVGTLTVRDLGELNLNPQEVEEVFLLPVAHFEENDPEEFSLRVEMQPWHTAENGERTMFFPAEELGLPPKYWKTWNAREHRVLVYRTEKYPIWGMTAKLIREVIGLLRRP